MTWDFLIVICIKTTVPYKNLHFLYNYFNFYNFFHVVWDKKMRLGAILIFPRIFRIFLELILIFLELFLIIRRLKNIFHELQIFYLDCSCLNLSIGIFLKFLWFFEYFSCSKNIFWCLVELISHWKINSKKTYPTGTGRARRPDPLGPPAKPIGARPHAAYSSHPSLVNCDQIQQFVTVELTTMTKFVYRHRKNNILWPNIFFVTAKRTSMTKQEIVTR
jgi:hypothetical protein